MRRRLDVIAAPGQLRSYASRVVYHMSVYIVFILFLFLAFIILVTLYFNEVAEKFEACGCAVVLGCTEIPLIVRPDDTPLPTLDSTRLLARATLRRVLEH